MTKYYCEYVILDQIGNIDWKILNKIIILHILQIIMEDFVINFLEI